ncbi:MAG TPA: thiol:disulfide interchange protein DsbA/DsbL [Rhodanobacteraceae bacterium]|nr:thiol:disulfide interchange protein DsbA/DsbL [Rhodanobacteraceae bacterium]
MKIRFVVAMLAGALLVSACAAKDSGAAQAQPQWTAGKNYFVISPAQPTGHTDKVEVTEVFSYACPHCAHFQPWAQKIKASLPDGAIMDYRPAVFHQSWLPFAKAFYVAKALNLLDETHQALFDALHRDHRPISSLQDLAQFYGNYGVDPQAFLSTAESFMVQTAVTKGVEWERACGVDGTPTIIIDGKYRVTGQSAGGYPQMVELIDWLVKKELAERGKA